MDTSVANRYLYDVDVYFSLSTTLASSPRAWFQFFMIILQTIRMNIHVNTNVECLWVWDKRHAHFLMPNTNDSHTKKCTQYVHMHACVYVVVCLSWWFIKWWSWKFKHKAEHFLASGKGVHGDLRYSICICIKPSLIPLSSCGGECLVHFIAWMTSMSDRGPWIHEQSTNHISLIKQA